MFFLFLYLSSIKKIYIDIAGKRPTNCVTTFFLNGKLILLKIISIDLRVITLLCMIRWTLLNSFTAVTNGWICQLFKTILHIHRKFDNLATVYRVSFYLLVSLFSSPLSPTPYYLLTFFFSLAGAEVELGVVGTTPSVWCFICFGFEPLIFGWYTICQLIKVA